MHTRPIQVPRKSTANTCTPMRPSPVPGSITRARPSTPAPVPPEPVRIVRFDSADVVTHLPEESVVRVDVNGCLAGAIRALGDAPRELGVGWAFMHGFFEASDPLGHVTVCEDRISIMVDGGEDLDRLRLEAVGWTPPQRAFPVAAVLNQADRLTITEDELARLVDKAFEQFSGDGGHAGYVHAAVASAESLHCVARDLQTDIAAAKVMGWTLLEGQDLDTRVLIVRGVVDQRVIRAAARCGMALVISDVVPTASAVQAAMRMSMTVTGMAMSRKIGIFVDGGHVVDESGQNTANEPVH